MRLETLRNLALEPNLQLTEEYKPKTRQKWENAAGKHAISRG